MNRAVVTRAGRAGLAVLVLVLTGLLACSSGRSEPRRTSSSRLGAAEPSVAPSSGAGADGLVRAVGSEPEGIVYDATTGLLAVAVRDPDRLQLLDGRTLALRRSVPIPGHARHLQLAGPGGPVLVPAEDADSLLQVDLSTGRTVTTKVGKSPHDAASVNGGRIVVGDEFGKSMTVVRNGRVERTITDRVFQPGGIIGDGDIVGLVDVFDFSLSTYDPATGRRIARLGAGRGPTHGVLAGPNRAVVADTRGNQILTFTLSPLAAVGRLALPGGPYGMAAAGSTGRVWVSLTARNEIVELDVSGSTPRVVRRLATVQQPNTVATSPDGRTVWVAGNRTGAVQRLTG